MHILKIEKLLKDDVFLDIFIKKRNCLQINEKTAIFQ